jgi:spore photoproduct lyase
MRMEPLQPSTIFYAPDALNARGRKALLTYPEAVHQPIVQHNRLPLLEKNHYQVKSDVLVLRVSLRLLGRTRNKSLAGLLSFFSALT